MLPILGKIKMPGHHSVTVNIKFEKMICNFYSFRSLNSTERRVGDIKRTLMFTL